MVKIFLGMIIGSMVTMTLLGGATAADQVLANAQSIYLRQLQRPDAATTLILLVIISLFLMTLSLWPQKPLIETRTFINKLKRHCK